jgi:hypothetical protein
VKKIQRLRHLAGILAVAAAPLGAHADSFIGASAGSAHWPHDNDSAWAIHAGTSVLPFVSVEARFVDLGKAGGVEAQAAGAGARVALPIAPLFALTGLAGVSRVRADAGADIGSRTTTQPYYGLGLRFTFAPGLDASLDAQRYKAELNGGGKADIDFFGIGLAYRF